MKQALGRLLRDVEILATGMLRFEPVVKVFKCERVLCLFRLGRPGPLAHCVHVLHHPDRPRGRVQVIDIAGVAFVPRG
eukprot:scaffold19721_cov60-Phaeocystis_antarctica.AAC.5